jgi:hypothetical protein
MSNDQNKKAAERTAAIDKPLEKDPAGQMLAGLPFAIAGIVGGVVEGGAAAGIGAAVEHIISEVIVEGKEILEQSDKASGLPVDSHDAASVPYDSSHDGDAGLPGGVASPEVNVSPAGYSDQNGGWVDHNADASGGGAADHSPTVTEFDQNGGWVDHTTDHNTGDGGGPADHSPTVTEFDQNGGWVDHNADASGGGAADNGANLTPGGPPHDNVGPDPAQMHHTDFDPPAH